MGKIKEIAKKVLGRIPWQDDKALQHKGIEDYLNRHTVRKLQFGCGPNYLNDWLNTDIYKGFNEVVYLDITKEFPLPSNSFDFITSEHLIEHIDFKQGKTFLVESLRILKSKGTIRITTPNLKTLLDLYYNKTAGTELYINHIISNFVPDASYNKEVFVINNAFRNWGHQFLYDSSTLTNLLTEAGFVDIKHVEPGISNHPELTGIDVRNKSESSLINQFEIMVFEATKP